MKRGSKDQIRKELAFHMTVTDQIRLKYKGAKQEMEKKQFSRIFTGGIAKKYKMIQCIKRKLGLSLRHLNQ